MRKLHTLILSGAYSPYEKTSPSILIKLDLLCIPIVQCESGLSSPNQDKLLELHQKNKHHIKQLSRHLKMAFLQDISPEAFFDSQNHIHSVYSALSKLDKIQTVNLHYLKMSHLPGLQVLARSLETLIAG